MESKASDMTWQRWGREDWMDRYENGTADMAITSGMPLDRDDLQAIAALALRGQPFGFTWEDVEAISVYYDPASRGHDLFPRELEARLRDLAARIAALLPPRA